jgi:hypothetical protein
MSRAKDFYRVYERDKEFYERTRMDPRLKGSSLSVPKLISSPLECKNQPGFDQLQTFYPGIGIISNLKIAPETDLWLDHSQRIKELLSQETSKRSGKVSLRVEKNTTTTGSDVQDISGFRKITHLLDPVRWLQGKYSLPKHTFLPWHQETWEAAWNKLQDPMNQAYVEALATYALSKLRENNLSPHFHLFYGAMCGKADTYAYNITDSYMSYRHARWFWTGQEKKVFALSFDESIPQEVKDAILQQPEELDSSDEDTESEQSDTSEEELTGMDCDAPETGSLHSADGSDFESASHESETTDDSTEGSDDDEELEIFADIQQFPVMMIYTEASEGTMDDLLDNFEEVGCEPGTEEWEQTWRAWVFQIIAALSTIQSVFGMTHNDLHSNNVVWTRTEKKFLEYKTRGGISFNVPTYGKIFRIIDFGRAIYKLNDQMFYSDDFKKGNDAAEQFNFGDLYDSSEPEVWPNPSFDLSRFTVSIFESLFPESPPVKKNGTILSEEPDLVVRETESELYNLLWSWLLCDDGHNVLMEPDGSERYPDFDLYKVITTQVHNAVPSEQFEKDIFKVFRVKYNEKAYSLFC